MPLGWVSGGARPVRVPRPIGFVDDRSFLLLCVVILVLVSFFVILVRRGTTGRFLAALRGSETAAQSIGINPTRIRILAFAVSAGIAGLGGGLLATQKHIATAQDFSYFYGLFLVVLVVTLVDAHRRGRGERRVRLRPAVAAHPRAARPQPGVGVRPVRPRGDHLRAASRGRPRVPEAALDGGDREAAPGAVPFHTRRRRRSRRPCSRPGGPTDAAPRRRGRQQALRRDHRARLGDARRRRRRGRGAHRPQRRGQDDLLQLPARPAADRRRHGRRSTAATSRTRRCTAGRVRVSGARSSAWSCSRR